MKNENRRFRPQLSNMQDNLMNDLVGLKTCSVLFIASSLLVACDTPTQGPEAKQTQVPKALEAQLDALEKARAVEDTIQDAVNDREKKFREAGI